MSSNDLRPPGKTRVETELDDEDLQKLEWLQIAKGSSRAGILREGLRVLDSLYKKFGI